MNSKRIMSGIVLAGLGSVLVYAAMAFLTDAPAMARALAAFPITTLVYMLALAFASFVVRAVRWGALMRVVGRPVSFVDALYLQLSGQTMSVTPGRVGEILKPWLASNTSGLPMTRGVALVFSERLADLIAVCCLALGGLGAIGGNLWVLVAVLAVILIATGIASSPWFHALALGVVEKQEWSRKHHASASAISQTIRTALTWRTLLWSVPSSIVAWGLEGVGFGLCLSALGFFKLSMVTAVSIYAIATLVGAFTFLPGGIGLTEASMAGILIALGMNASDAAAATLITRITTLWWGVGVGWIAIATRPSLFARLLSATDEDDAAEDSTTNTAND
ncbi:MAG: flippase-like domain-containing protein [Coriobacteriia bacterium]|nr:flippase-like domain-containing protein [Coriobacteriia bacterium]